MIEPFVPHTDRGLNHVVSLPLFPVEMVTGTGVHCGDDEEFKGVLPLDFPDLGRRIGFVPRTDVANGKSLVFQGVDEVRDTFGVVERDEDAVFC